MKSIHTLHSRTWINQMKKKKRELLSHNNVNYWTYLGDAEIKEKG